MSSDTFAERFPHGVVQSFWQSLALNLAKSWKRLRIQIGPRPRTLQLQETLALGEKRFLAIVRCGEERFLIGSAQGSLSLLATLSDDEVAFEGVLRRSQAAEAAK